MPSFSNSAQTNVDNADDIDVKFAHLISTALEKMLSKSQQASPDTSAPQSTLFHAKSIPAITVAQYVARILRYAPCSGECFVTALIYMNRALAQLGPRFLDQSTVHRFLISAVLLSSKFLDDLYYNNTFYAKVGGISPHEMNALELELLHIISFQLHVDRAEYLAFASRLWTEYQLSFPSASVPALPSPLTPPTLAKPAAESAPFQPFPLLKRPLVS